MAGMVKELRAFIKEVKAPVRIHHFSSSFQISFTGDVPLGSLFWYWIRFKGVHTWEGRTWFITASHTDKDIAFVVQAFKESIQELQEAGILPHAGASFEITEGAPSHPARSFKEGKVPMTEAQKEIWLVSQVSASASCCYNESFTLHLNGLLDVDKLTRAIQEAVSYTPLTLPTNREV